MRYSTLVAETQERDTLLAKKRLGKNQKSRLATLSESLDSVQIPPATPRRAPTGERGDFQGNTYAMHSGKPMSLRATRRAHKSGIYTVQFMRSRIQRSRRKQRTGSVK